MAEVAFDTIAEVRRLRDVGFAQDQAEAITRSIHAGVTGGVATRTDLAMAETGLRGDMERLGGEVRAVEAGLRTDMERLGGDLRTEIAGVRTELKEDIAGLRAEIAGVRTELKEDIAGLRAEIAGVRTELKEDIAGLRTEIAGVRTEVGDIRTQIAAGQAVQLRWVAGMAIAMFAALVGILFL